MGGSCAGGGDEQKQKKARTQNWVKLNVNDYENLSHINLKREIAKCQEKEAKKQEMEDHAKRVDAIKSALRTRNKGLIQSENDIYNRSTGENNKMKHNTQQANLDKTKAQEDAINSLKTYLPQKTVTYMHRR